MKENPECKEKCDEVRDAIDLYNMQLKNMTSTAINDLYSLNKQLEDAMREIK